MKQFLLRRFVSLIVSLIIISVAAFLLLQLTPGDPLLRISFSSTNQSGNRMVPGDEVYNEIYNSYGFNLPVFYISFTNLAIPDSFKYLPDPTFRNQIISLSKKSGNPKLSYKLGNEIKELNKNANLQLNLSVEQHFKLINHVAKLKIQNSPTEILYLVNEFNEFGYHENYIKHFQTIKQVSSAINNDKSGWKQFVPVVTFNAKNQFHYWMFGKNNSNGTATKGVLEGNFGLSWINNQEVSSVLKRPFLISLILAVFISLFSFGLSIPVAGFLVLNKNKKWVGYANDFLIFMYSIPLFWIGILFLYCFASPYFFNWFPSSGILPIGGFDQNITLIEKVASVIYHLVLPFVSLFIGGFVFFTRVLQSTLLQQLEMDYITTEKSFGHSQRRIIFKYAMRNAITPTVAFIFVAFPAMLSGSVLIENIYSIPGMGSLLVRSIQNQDFPVLVSYFLLIGFITTISFFFLDVIMRFVDPRTKNKIGGFANE
jgi:peptide/nickel transport system permease protein